MRTPAIPLFTAALLVAITATAQAEKIAWQEHLPTAHAKAKAENKPLLLHFYRDDCAPCRRLDAGAFQNREVCNAINSQFVPVKIHAGDNPTVRDKFRVTSVPTDVVVTWQGKVLSYSHSPQEPHQYVAMLKETHSATEPDMMPHQRPSAPTIASNNAEMSPGKPKSTAATMPSEATTPTATASIQMPSAVQPPAATNPAADELAMPNHGAAPESAHQRFSDQPQVHLTGSSPSSGGSAVQPPVSTGKSAGNQTADSTVAGSDVEPKPQPELALQGFCAVSVATENRWVEGSPDYGVIHLGKLYLFASEKAMQTFLDSPIKYTPMLNGIDVVHFFEEQRIVPGKREFGLKDQIYDRMFFFADEASRNQFEEHYEKYTDDAVRVMNRAVRDANPGS